MKKTLMDVGEQLFAMRPVRVVFHLSDGSTVEADAIGWSLHIRNDKLLQEAEVRVREKKSGEYQ